MPDAEAGPDLSLGIRVLGVQGSRRERQGRDKRGGATPAHPPALGPPRRCCPGRRGPVSAGRWPPPAPPPARARAAPAAHPSCSSISAPVSTVAIGLATPFPTRGGAEPCTGSNSPARPGWRLALAAMPSPPIEPRAQVREDVAIEVGGDDDLEPLRLAHQFQRQRVHVAVLPLDVGVAVADLLEQPCPRSAGTGWRSTCRSSSRASCRAPPPTRRPPR